MKKTNKGFSLVELIIVIAIMAILAGAIAPALIRYIDKSRKSNDVSSAKTIKTSIETAMAKEKTYELLTAGSGASITVFTGKETKNLTDDTVVKITQNATIDSKTEAISQARQEIGTNIGEKTPRIKYKKQKDGTALTNAAQQCFLAYITAGGTVQVGISLDNGATMHAVLAPDVDENYQ